MADNMLSTAATDAFSQFRNGPNDAIHSSELRPVFDNLPSADQQLVTDTVRRFNPRNQQSYQALSAALGVSLPVAYGLMSLLHPDA